MNGGGPARLQPKGGVAEPHHPPIGGEVGAGQRLGVGPEHRLDRGRQGRGVQGVARLIAQMPRVGGLLGLQGRHVRLPVLPFEQGEGADQRPGDAGQRGQHDLGLERRPGAPQERIARQGHQLFRIDMVRKYIALVLNEAPGP